MSHAGVEGLDEAIRVFALNAPLLAGLVGFTLDNIIPGLINRFIYAELFFYVANFCLKDQSPWILLYLTVLHIFEISLLGSKEERGMALQCDTSKDNMTYSDMSPYTTHFLYCISRHPIVRFIPFLPSRSDLPPKPEDDITMV